MNNEMFRGALIDGTFVYGWLHHLTKNLGRIKAGYYINNRAGSPFAYELRPETISMKTYQLDKSKEMIYGSFELEGFGMTKGGDVVMLKTCDIDKAIVFFGIGGAFWIKWLSDGNEELLSDYNMNDFRIIDKQYDGEV